MRFQDALDRKAEDIERPRQLPVGTYMFKVDKLPEQGSVAKGAWDTLDFYMRPVEAGDDVDPDEVQAFGDVTNARIRHRFMFNTDPGETVAFERTMFFLKRFIVEHLGVEWNDDMELQEVLSQTVGQVCTGAVTWRMDPTDNETVYAELSSTAPAG